MSHKLISFIIALVFLVLLATASGAFRILFPLLLVYAAAVLLYNHYYFKKQGAFSFWAWAKIFLFMAGAVAVYFVLPGGFFKGFYLILAAALLFGFELGLAVVSEQLNFMLTLLTYFGFSMGIFALNFYLLPGSLLVLVLLAAATFAVTRSALDYIPQPEKIKNFFSGILALALLEIGWALMQLPFHFTVLAVIMFNAFYVIWIVLYYHLYHNLNFKKIYFHIALSGLIILLVLLSTPWK